MASKNKTRETSADVSEFIHSFVEIKEKREDSFALIKLMQKWSGAEPKMWGPNIIGFGHYHYRYASGREGEAPYFGFSPRKIAFSLYVVSPLEEQLALVQRLGKCRKAKYCIYFKRLSDLDLTILEKLCKSTLQYIQTTYGAKLP